MVTAAARLKSRKKVELLRNPLFSDAFYDYFRGNWQAQEVLDRLRSLGADCELLREWALFSFHSLGKDEAEEKRKRGEKMLACLKSAITGYNSAMEFYSMYASAPHHDIPVLRTNAERSRKLYEANEELAKEAFAWLERTEKSLVYTTKRLGVNWQRAYLFLMKLYIRGLSNWEDTRILEAVTYLVEAGHKSLKVRIPHDLRALIRCAIRDFESDSRNADIIGLLRQSVGNSKALYEMFRPLSSNQGESGSRNPETK